MKEENQGNHCDLPENKNTKHRKRKARVVVTVAPHQEEVNVGTQPPQILLDLEIPEKGTQICVPPNQTTVTAETSAEPPNAEIPPELEVELTQGAEHDQPVNQPAVTRPRWEKHEPPYFKD